MVMVQSQSWAARQDGIGNDRALALSTDSVGNVYVAGEYDSSPLVVYSASGASVASVANSGSFGGYVVKYTSNGSFVWAAQLDGNGDDVSTSLSIDQQGNVYVAGYYDSSPLVVYSASGASVASLANSGSFGGYVVKYTSNGSFVWAASQDGIYDDKAAELSSDQQGNVYVAGYYASPPLVVYSASGAIGASLVYSGGNDAYLVKYASNGSFVWAARQDGSGADYASALSSDQQGNVYVAGYYASSPFVVYSASDAIGASLAHSGSSGAYLVKYTSNGSFVWASRQDGAGVDFANAVATDYQGNVYVAGYYTSSPLVVYSASGANISQLANTGSSGAYLVKYAQNGSFVWAARQDGNGFDQIIALSIDPVGNVYVAGDYGSSSLVVYSAAGAIVASLAGSGSFGGYVVKYASNGSFVWANRQDGNGIDQSNALSIDPVGNLYVGGYYASSPLVVFDAFDVNVQQLNNSGSYGSYIIKYSDLGTFKNQNLFIISGSSLGTSVSSFISFVTPTLTPTSPIVSQTSTYTSLSLTSMSIKAYSTPTSTPTNIILVLTETLGSMTWTEHVTTFSTSSYPQALSWTFSTPALTSTQSLLVQSSLNLLALPTYEFSLRGFSSSVITRQDHLNFVSLNSGLNVIYLIISGVALLVLGCVCILCSWSRRLRNLSKARAKFFEHTTTNMDQTTVTSNLTTAMVTSHVLAVPQFLALKFGVTIRQLSQIAKGGGGSIHHCHVLDASQIPGYDGCKLVIKNLGKDASQLSPIVCDSFYQEVSMLHLFRDQRPFARMYGFTEQPATIVLKFYEQGSLKQYILAETRTCSVFVFSKRQLLILQVRLSQGLLYMHQKQFVHCDVKPDNVLLESVNGCLEPRLTDFGISRVLSDSASMVKAFRISLIKGASISYAGPEVILRFRKNFVEKQAEVWKAGDVYAVAVVFYEMLQRKKVWHMP